MTNQRRTPRLYRELAAFSLALVLFVCAAPLRDTFRAACGTGCCRSKRTCSCANPAPVRSWLASHCSSHCGSPVLVTAVALPLPVLARLRGGLRIPALLRDSVPHRSLTLLPLLLRQRPPPVRVS